MGVSVGKGVAVRVGGALVAVGIRVGGISRVGVGLAVGLTVAATATAWVMVLAGVTVVGGRVAESEAGSSPPHPLTPNKTKISTKTKRILGIGDLDFA